MHLEHLVDHRFAIERLAGSGGMGVVYRAEDLRTGTPVALKVLRGASLREERVRFEREALAIAEIDHPGVVRYVAHGLTAEGHPYLAMEWIDGDTLEARLRRGPLSVAETLTLGVRLAESIAATHACGVVHRDLKPSNVLLAGDALERAKIVDFGLATFPAAIRATLSGVVLGTPAYMAPEQARAEHNLDARVDVFALGCVLHECLSGKPVFDGRHVMAVLAKIVFDEVPRLGDLGCAVPLPLDELIAWMLTKDPAGRPADGGAIVLALCAFDAVTELSRDLAQACPTSARLTRAEQRLRAVVLAREPPAAPAAADAETVIQSGTGGTPELRAIIGAIEARGGHAVPLADGTLVVTPHSAGVATDQAALAACYALSLRVALPGWTIAVATGRAETEGARPFGDAVERAARRLRARQRAVGPIEIDLDDVTAGLLDLRFDVRLDALGLTLRGEHDLAEGARTLLGRPTAFVGRDREMATLLAIFRECVDEPRAHAVLVTGPAGVGKSRLRHELLTRLRPQAGVEIWTARGDPMRAGAPFGVLAPLLRRVARVFDGEPIEARRQKLLARVARYVAAAERQRVAEFLGELVGTPFPDEGRVQLRAARQDPRLVGDQMRRAFLDFVDAETAAGPLVVVLEDMHWGDRPSADYLDAALRLFADRPLLCVSHARPEIHDGLPRLWQERAAQEIRLPELPRRACERLARDVLGDSTAPATLTSLWKRSGGNAFFLEELLRATAEGRAGALPETMLAMVESRLEALDVEARRLLRAASVFGETFWRSGVAALVGSEEHLDAELGRLEAAEWVVRRPDPRFGGEVEYGFRHALVREGAYGTLTKEDRALGHRLVGAWLAAAGEADALVLAEHHERGAEAAEAARCYALATEQALEANDLAAVVARSDRALALGVRGEALGSAALSRAIAHNWRGERADAEEWARQAAAALPVGSERWCAALGEAIWTAGARGDGAEVARLGASLLGVLDDDRATGAAVIALTHAVGWSLMIGRYDAARALCDAAAPTVAKWQDEPAIRAAWTMVEVFFNSRHGDPLRLRELLKRAISLFDAAGDRRQACFRRAGFAEACIRLGAHAEAEVAARAALAEAEHLGVTHAAVQAKHALGLALARQDKLAEAVSTLREALATYTSAVDQYMDGMTRVYLAEAYRRRGDLDAAEREASDALLLLAAFPTFILLARASLADVLLAQGRTAEALDQAQQGFDFLTAIAPVEEGDAYVRVVHASALHVEGKHEDARAAIAAARARLLDSADRIGDEDWRRSFLENVPENARTLALARHWLED
jgi:tetratricopeptide (TPR) repeat protein